MSALSVLTHAFAPAAARHAFPRASAVIGLAVLAGLAGVLSLNGLLDSMTQASSADARPAPRAMALPFAQATGVALSDTTVPAASTVFAGREEVIEEPAPTF